MKYLPGTFLKNAMCLVAQILFYESWGWRGTERAKMKREVEIVPREMVGKCKML